MSALEDRLQQASSFPLPVAMATIVGLSAVGGMALLAAGQVGRIHLVGAPADAEVVLSAVWHSILGCVLTAVQWGAGAGLALWLCRDISPLGRLLLLGFPLSLIAVAGWSYLVLALPFGWIAATAVLIACFASFVRWPPRQEELRRLGLVILALLPSSVLWGCWMGLLAHGPTQALPGSPSGDVGYYASSIYSLNIQPMPFVNYANEGERLFPFNMLHSVFGAALMRFIAIEAFQFVLAAGGSMFVFGLGLALHAYLSLRATVATRFSYVILALAAVVATRYPYWIVESPPMIFALPLTVSIWYRATSDRSVTATFANCAMAIVASALSKVTSIITLGPLSLAPLARESRGRLQQFRTLSPAVQALSIVIAAAALLYAALMLYRFGPYMLAQGGIKPESYERYEWATQFHVGRRAILPYLLRDSGTVLFVVLAFRMLSWPFATALAGGLIAALVVPYFGRVNLYCAAVILALAGIDHPLLLRKSKSLALAACLLCLPAILQIDFGGPPSGAVWVLCISLMAWSVCAQTPFDTNAASPSMPRFAAFGSVTLALLGALALLAVARQQIIFSGPSQYTTIPPEAHDIWTEVRQRTPQRALIFTDQTGAEPFSAVGGWNTYATTGQRQIFVAGWYQTPELRQSPQLLMERLRLNQAVLSGEVPPGDLHYRRGPYSDYFAVVSRARVMPPTWLKTYENGAYTLYRYHQQVGSKV